jgi:hypothetical protein
MLEEPEEPDDNRGNVYEADKQSYIVDFEDEESKQRKSTLWDDIHGLLHEII